MENGFWILIFDRKFFLSSFEVPAKTLDWRRRTLVWLDQVDGEKIIWQNDLLSDLIWLERTPRCSKRGPSCRKASQSIPIILPYKNDFLNIVRYSVTKVFPDVNGELPLASSAFHSDAIQKVPRWLKSFHFSFILKPAGLLNKKPADDFPFKFLSFSVHVLANWIFFRSF